MNECIKCGEEIELIKSHIISRFLGKRVYNGPGKNESFDIVSGNTTQAGKTPKINWKYLQDMPKPQLMCQPCDGSFSKDERALAALIDSSNIFSPPISIYNSPCLIPTSLQGLEGFMEYQLPSQQQSLVRRIGILSCWRALHATAKSSSNEKTPSPVKRYLNSLRGLKMNTAVKQYFDHNTAPEPGHFFLLLPPESLTLELSGNEALAPHGWDVVVIAGDDGKPCYVVVVWFAYWMLVWLPDLAINSDDPVVHSIVAEIRAAQVASWWPLNKLKPRVEKAIELYNGKASRNK